MYQDLRDFIEQASSDLGEVRSIKGADLDTDVGPLTEILAFHKPSLAGLFDEIKGYPKGFRIFTNSVNSNARAALCVGLSKNSSSPIDYIKEWKERSSHFQPIAPKEVSEGPVFENKFSESELDLTKIPVPKWHAIDGGKYIGTGCVVINRDPESGIVNLGCYRLQLHEKNLLGLMMSPGRHGKIICEKYWSKGKSCPVVVTFGQDPAIFFESMYGQPYGSVGFGLAGWVKGEPIPIILGPKTGLPIPASAEIAIEGEVPPPQELSRTEGPFGEWVGYYAHGARAEPVVRVLTEYHRNDPILVGAPPMKPPMAMDFGLPIGASKIWEGLEKIGIPGVTGVWLHHYGAPGGGTMYAIVALRQSYSGQAKQVALATASIRPAAYFCRYVIVVDEDIDITSIDDVLWALATRCEPKEDIEIVSGTWSTFLDPRIPPEQKEARKTQNSKMLFIACKPFDWKDRFPPVNAIDAETRRKAIAKWGKVLGDGF